MKKSIVCILSLLFVTNVYGAEGSLSGFVTCPAPGISGFTYQETFNLQGPTPPPNAEITYVAGSWEVYDSHPDLVVVFGNDTITFIDASTSTQWWTDVWNGLPPTHIFQVRMFVNGPYEPTGITGGGLCQIHVSWESEDPNSEDLIKALRMLRIVAGGDGDAIGISDANGDGKAGLEEAINYLRQ